MALMTHLLEAVNELHGIDSDRLQQCLTFVPERGQGTQGSAEEQAEPVDRGEVMEFLQEEELENAGTISTSVWNKQ